MLKKNTIQVVVDVRSAPYSRYVPQFNKGDIQHALQHAGFRYIFMGDAIGGKPSDPLFLDQNGIADYAKIAQSKKFRQGIDRLLKGLADGWVIALMCAEEDPLKCHRHLLIARELELRHNVIVWHIRCDETKIRAKQFFEASCRQLRLFP
ncbi:MAG: DUF488 domain-containing protein [Desulfobulbaceae bacterium]|nr:DUF488 domain-containing protein [Desulfobulbaceae bacterium]